MEGAPGGRANHAGGLAPRWLQLTAITTMYPLGVGFALYVII